MEDAPVHVLGTVDLVEERPESEETPNQQKLHPHEKQDVERQRKGQTQFRRNLQKIPRTRHYRVAVHEVREQLHQQHHARPAQGVH